ncbi:zf-CCHC domain-containing protein [Tanacetum coccineum]
MEMEMIQESQPLHGSLGGVISFKEEIAKYAFETTKSQVPCVRSPSLLQDHLAVVYSCEYHYCAFSRFNTIITSLKALDESFSSRNLVRKFLRALHTKWRPKVMAIEESKDFSTLFLDELIVNLKVYEVVLEKDLEVSKNKKEKYKSFALKARQAKEDKKEKEDRRCFKCGDPNHFISDCPKHSFGDQKVFVVSCWSDSGDDSKKEEICLMAQSNEVQSDTPYYSSSTLDNKSRQDDQAMVLSSSKSLDTAYASRMIRQSQFCSLEQAGSLAEGTGVAGSTESISSF